MNSSRNPILFFKQLANNLKIILLKIWSVLKHPSTGTIIGIMGIMIGILWTTVSTPVKLPVYSVSSPYLVANSIQKGSKLKIFWDKQEINNAAIIKVAIWNEGSIFIDKNDISYTNPIRIKPPEKVDILSVKVTSKSRKDLEFASVIEADKDGFESIVVNIKGNEALEKNDGAIFNILYSSKKSWCICKWEVNGRIKGVPNGFDLRAWNNANTYNFWKIYSLGIFALIILFVSVSIKSFRLHWKIIQLKIQKNRKLSLSKLVDMIITVCFFVLLLFMLYIGIYNLTVIKTVPLWLEKAIM